MASRSINKVMVMGNMVRDPELRYTAKGTPVCTFSVATNREWSPSGGGETQEEAEFHNIVAWSKLGELCAQLLYKGRQVYIEGRLRTRDWEDEASGKRMYRTEIVAGEMIALGAPKDTDRENVSVSQEPKVSNQSDEIQLQEKSSESSDKTEDAANGEEIPF